ncbi:hypothetical protein ACVGW4_07830, partial [Enterobacter hormaechei]
LERAPLGVLAGPLRVEAFENFTHVVWAPGGGMVPEDERAKFYPNGKKLCGWAATAYPANSARLLKPR